MSFLIEFIFPGRLHRLAYFLRGVTTDIFGGCIYAFSGTNASSIWLVLLLAALGVYQMFFVILPRIRDIGMGGWWLLLMLVPGVNVVFGIILLFRAPVILSNSCNPALQATAAAPSN
jgi:uncharacterized membrane protein YhaH (DUF805 family)